MVGNRRLEADIESPTKRHKTAVVLDIYGRRYSLDFIFWRDFVLFEWRLFYIYYSFTYLQSLRIDMQQLKPDPSLYSLARAWIHSDIVPHNIFSTKSNQVRLKFMYQTHTKIASHSPFFLSFFLFYYISSRLVVIFPHPRLVSLGKSLRILMFYFLWVRLLRYGALVVINYMNTLKSWERKVLIILSWLILGFDQ